MVSLSAPFGSPISLDLTKQFGGSVELQAFQFVVPPIEFRLVRGEIPLQEWQAENTQIYDLQHGPRVKEWARDDHWFVNDLHHRADVQTCGVLARELVMETRGIALMCVLLIWLREGTWHSVDATPKELKIL